MFKDSIPGINKVFENDPAPGSVIIVTGGPGTLKSSFIFSVMSGYLNKHHGENGIYVTLEETKETHLRNMQSLKVKFNDRMRIYDVASFRSDMDYENMTSYIHPKEYIDLVLRGITNLVKKPGALKDGGPAAGADEKVTCYALDSLNALQDLAKIYDVMHRQKLYELFYTLRNTRVTSFIVYENLNAADQGFEYYLADGIIELGMHKEPSGTKRFMQVKKMKGVKHSLDPFMIDIGKDGGLQIVNPLLSSVRNGNIA